MKEVLTKRFWQGLKKTFDEAREDPPAPPDQALQPPDKDELNVSSGSGAPTPPSVSGERH